jgi:hypothetical protein
MAAPNTFGMLCRCVNIRLTPPRWLNLLIITIDLVNGSLPNGTAAPAALVDVDLAAAVGGAHMFSLSVYDCKL